MTNLTPLILSYNELPNIERTLSRLEWADRIVVVDSGSTDGTLDALARYPNVEVHHRPFDTHRDQWNAGLDLVDTPWVMTLDADYVLSPELVDEVRALVTGTDGDPVGYDARFVYCIKGKPLNGTLYPPRTVLFQTDRGRYVQDGHTQRLKLDGETGTVKSVIFHDDRKPRSRWLANQSAYAAQEADKLLASDPQALRYSDRIRRTGLAPFLTPLYCLLVKRLAFDGRAGLAYTYERTYAELLLSLQILDRRLAADHA